MKKTKCNKLVKYGTIFLLICILWIFFPALDMAVFFAFPIPQLKTNHQRIPKFDQKDKKKNVTKDKIFP